MGVWFWSARWQRVERAGREGEHGGRKICYLPSPIPEVFAKILDVERDKANPRYGKPTLYQVTQRTTTNEATETVNALDALFACGGGW